jgi:hypothetical protein
MLGKEWVDGDPHGNTQSAGSAQAKKILSLFETMS